ncbi:Uncharacterised protein [Mycobacteroides abscessus subsp. abscessus]|nr:Uncharacterised protein [Mycobacteroides abscessus subsp. abscessus]
MQTSEKMIAIGPPLRSPMSMPKNPSTILPSASTSTPTRPASSIRWNLGVTRMAPERYTNSMPMNTPTVPRIAWPIRAPALAPATWKVRAKEIAPTNRPSSAA